MPDNATPLWCDQEFLRNVQYATDRNLAARQSIYAYQDSGIYLPAAVIDSLALTGAETVADIGCGNGVYLAELHRRGHAGRLIGLDASPGMLKAAGPGSPDAAMVNGDAMDLPLRDGAADIVLAMHMLYHLPDPAAAVAGLRRVTKPGGRTVIGLNSADHLRQLRAVINAVLTQEIVREKISLDDGEALAARVFGSVVRHDLVRELKVPGPEPVADYVRSMSLTRLTNDSERIVSGVTDNLPFGADGLFRVTTHCGWLVCS